MSARWRLPFPCVLALALLATAAEARLYRWVDDDGAVHYTDTLPPAQVERGHSEMTEKGVVVGITAPAKTLEEVQREDELKRFRDAADRAKKQQEAADRVLLRTFRSVDDMVMARDGKLASIDVMVQVTRSNIRRQQDWLRGLRADAANLERTGKPIPQHLSDSIGKTEKSIREAYAAIVDREQQKQEIHASFASDLKRFRQLKDIPEAAEPKQEKAPLTLLKNLVPCTSTESCDRLWARATAYVRKHASTPVQASGPNILITAPPDQPDDVSLTLSRIQDKQGTGASLFLDAQCKPSPNGDTTCTAPEAQAILNGFHDAVLGQAPEG
jgi:hypothetical protein